ncbi:hypothetical protein BGZ54_005353 [Gamsiella multidivaricata]|nr:hypothetical protein BGZ54_005353 [Gamsiella multidivaricata]
MDDTQVANALISYSPTSSLDSSSPTFGINSSPGVRSISRVNSLPLRDSDLSRFDMPKDFIGHTIPRHGSVGSLYPVTQSHELLDSSFDGAARFELSTAMIPNSSSDSSLLPNPMLDGGGEAGARPKPQRRASLNPDSQRRVFTCILDDCGKLFKRSEHLKRHVRSVHTLEKPFLCSHPGCLKRFSRSDNLNQHVRIHRHDKEKCAPKMPFTNFTPFYPQP